MKRESMLISFMPTWHKLVIERRESQVRKFLHKYKLQVSLWGVFLISDWCRKCQPVLGGASQGKQANKHNHSLASASAPASRFLPWLSSWMNNGIEVQVE